MTGSSSCFWAMARSFFASSLGQREAADGLALGDAGKPALLLGVTAGEQQGLGGQVDRRGEWGGGEAPAELLGDDAQLEVTEAGAAVGLGDRGAHPAHLAHSAPELRVVRFGPLEDAADAGGGRVLGEELPRLLAQGLLVGREVEVHGGRIIRHPRAGRQPGRRGPHA